MKIRLTQLALLFIAISFGAVFSSCSKDDDPKPTMLTQEQKWGKEVFEAMQEIYLWNDALPATFDASKYAKADDALEYLIKLKVDPSTNKPIDKYSFLDKIGGLSGEIGEGKKSGDYGFMIQPAPNNDKQIAFYVNYVFAASSAGKAGVERAYEIVEVNGSSDVHPKLKDPTHLDTESSGFKNVVNAFVNSTSASFKFRRPNGTILETSLMRGDFDINSVLHSSTYEVNAKKIGYIVFKQFLEEKSVTELKDAFTKFESEGISELIVDLRYNGGGSVATCEILSSLIAPPSTNGQVMHYTVYNKLLDEYFKSKEGNEYNITKFKKENNLAINRVFFIVSENTASASELLINNLKPHMEVKLIGERTYGKPCGFWATPIGYDRKSTATKVGYDLYAVSFETLNSKKEGRYYSGMPVDKEAIDDYRYEWGNKNEPCFGQALYYIANGSFADAKKSSKMAIKSNIDRSFIGMIDYRGHK